MENRTLRLLVVDDLDNWRRDVKRLFQDRPDIIITEAVNREDALGQITTADFDLVLLDMRMPGKSRIPSDEEGFRTLEEIQRLKPGMKVLMMSAYSDVRKTAAAMRAGAIGFVPKEEDFLDLLTAEINDFTQTTLLIADREELIRTKYEEAKTAKDANKKGKALEVLMTAVFNSIDGFTAIPDERNSTEQIDIFITNRSSDEFWRKEKQFFVAECKNWSKKAVGSPVLSRLETNIRNRSGRCSLGFLVSLKPVAKTIKDDMRGLRRESILIVPIDGKRLRRLVEATPVERDRLLQDFVREAASS